MRRVIVLIATMILVVVSAVGCKGVTEMKQEKKEIDRESTVVSKLDKREEDTEMERVTIVDNDQYVIAMTGTMYTSEKRDLILKIENKMAQEISISVQNATLDGTAQQAACSQESIYPDETASCTITFEKESDFQTSSGEIIVQNSQTGEILGTYPYEIEIVPKTEA